MTEAALPPNTSTGAPDRLESWKEIATYLGRGVTTVQRWEQEEELPVHRLQHAKKGSVFAYRRELDAWRHNRATAPTKVLDLPTATDPGALGDFDELAPAAPSAAKWIFVSGAILAVIAIATVTLARSDTSPGPAPIADRAPAASTPTVIRPTQLLATADDERAPSFSPDGRYLAFALTSESSAGVYVQPVPAGPMRLLWSFRPEGQAVYITKWSPRGDLIAFNSEEGHDTYGLYVIAAAGGTATRLTSMAGVGICWAADGQSLTFADRTSTAEPFSLYSISLASRERSRLTTPPAGTFGDTACAWSPTGARLAIARFSTRYEADVFVAEPGLERSPERVAIGTGGIDDLVWDPGNDTIVFTSNPGLRRVSADASGASTPLAGLQGGIAHPTFSRPRNGAAPLLAYQTEGAGLQTWLWTDSAAATTRSWLGDDAFDSEFPALTRDGRRVAYVKDGEVWTANVDGTGHRQITFHGGSAGDRIVTGPRWSPDGTRLAFSVPVGEQREIYLIDQDGANSFRLTHEPSLEDNPSWSMDGRWIYFRSDRSGLNHIWKAPAEGGAAVRVTRGEGWQALESTDGTSLFFVKSTWQPGLWRVSTRGGDETLLIPGVLESRWSVTAAGILYVDTPEHHSPTLRIRPFASPGAARSLVTLPAEAFVGFSASADARTVLWTRGRRRLSDIMLVTP